MDAAHIQAILDELMNRSKQRDLSDIRFLELSGIEDSIAVNGLITLRLLSSYALVHSLAKMKGRESASIFKFFRGALSLWFKYRKEEKRHLLQTSGE